MNLSDATESATGSNVSGTAGSVMDAAVVGEGTTGTFGFRALLNT
jgi:hypothetical protein